MIKLQVPAGGDSASFEGVTYKANKKGIVEVPEASVGNFIRFHGFAIIPEKIAPTIAPAAIVEVVVAAEKVADSPVVELTESEAEEIAAIEEKLEEIEADEILTDSEVQEVSTAKEKLTLKLNK